jgi:hypothetical protein
MNPVKLSLPNEKTRVGTIRLRKKENGSQIHLQFCSAPSNEGALYSCINMAGDAALLFYRI